MSITDNFSVEAGSFYDDHDGLVARLAAKISFTADILKQTVGTAEILQRQQNTIDRYVHQISLILTWKKCTASLKLTGAAAKVFGNLMVLLRHSKLGLAMRMGQKLWKFGVGLKVLSAAAVMLKELWERGCRNAVLEFIQRTRQLTKNLDVLGELICDLQSLALPIKNINTIQVPEEIVNLVRHFIPPDQFAYAVHVINLAFGSRYYSPLLDSIILSSCPASESNAVQLLREIETCHFIDFIKQNDSKAITVAGSFFHISQELLDFFDGLQRVTDKDCRFLLECVANFNQVSVTIMKVASALTSLDHKNQ